MVSRLLTPRNGATACLAAAALSLFAVSAIGIAHLLVLGTAITAGRIGRLPRLSRRTWDILALVALAVFVPDAILLSRDLIGAALRLLTFVTVHRCVMTSHPSDRIDMTQSEGLRQALSLSFVQMVAAAASTTEAWFALPLAIYAFLGVGTLMALAAEGPAAGTTPRRVVPVRASAVALPTVATGALGMAIFFVIPHFGTGYFRPQSGAALAFAGGDAMSGFSDHVELGSIGRIKRNNAVVMRVRVDASILEPEAYRWRGLALDTFDGRSWQVSDRASERRWVGTGRDGWMRIAPEETAGPDRQITHDVVMEPIPHAVLFTPPVASSVSSRDISWLGVDAEGSLHLRDPLLMRLSYRIVGSPDGASARGATDPLSEGDRKRYLALPRQDPQVGELARSVSAGSNSAFESARRIEDHLRENFAYTLEINDAAVEDPLRHFLLERQAGHCEYFATAMAVMLRHLQIPSRLVTGFTAGEWSPLTGSWLVRQSDAHSWVEAWIAGRGWTPFDPTPSQAGTLQDEGLWTRMRGGLASLEVAWDTWIIGLDIVDQQSVATGLYDAAAFAGRAAASAIAPVEDGARALVASGWKRWTFILAGLAAAAAVLAALRMSLLRGARWRGFLPASGTRAATRRLRRFEIRWAWRGMRRAPGQTPLEFALDLELRSLAGGDAPAFIRDYYRARYGSWRPPRAEDHGPAA